MIARGLVYLLVAVGIAGTAVYLNHRADRAQYKLHVDPREAAGLPHDHDLTGTGCLCDPEAEIRQALADRADYAETHRSLGDRFYRRGRYQIAIERYARAVELDPANAQALYGLGLALMRQARYDEARKPLQGAIEANRKFVDAYVTLGLAYYCSGDFHAAREQWQAAIRIQPGHAYATKLIATLPTIERTE
jgi:tetratricopeptide (TPR) repeat protein